MNEFNTYINHEVVIVLLVYEQYTMNKLQLNLKRIFNKERCTWG